MLADVVRWFAVRFLFYLSAACAAAAILFAAYTYSVFAIN